MSEDTTFVWDPTSQLYYHASTGFYHDPIGGWYYSSRDGLYYKFETGDYVLLNSDQGRNSEIQSSENVDADNVVEDKQYDNIQCNKIDEREAEKEGAGLDEPALGEKDVYIDADCLADADNELPENPTRPSEWLEDTLIELYLSGYSNEAASAASEMTIDDTQANHTDDLHVLGDGDNDELEEGEWIPDEEQYSAILRGDFVDEDEERWKAQYGQATRSIEESEPSIRGVELWDWTTVNESRKRGKGHVTRLVGRLVKRSSKLHPSVPSGGGLFKTAPIREVHLDLVRVSSGQVYRLRSPSSQYLASISSYKSSNPTKDWAFPPLSTSDVVQPPLLEGKCESTRTEASLSQDNSLAMEKQLEMKGSHTYRDRAAERRALHRGFGVGPGQKKSQNDVDADLSPPTSTNTEEAAAESLNLSFGAGSYGRKVLESMGWKEGRGAWRQHEGPD